MNNRYATEIEANRNKTGVYRVIVKDLLNNNYLLSCFSLPFAKKIYSGLFFEVVEYPNKGV